MADFRFPADSELGRFERSAAELRALAIESLSDVGCMTPELASSLREPGGLPSAADLDAVAAEQGLRQPRIVHECPHCEGGGMLEVGPGVGGAYYTEECYLCAGTGEVSR